MRSSLLPEAERRAQSGALSATNTLDLHLYLDGSVLELVANGRLTLNTRVYPSRDDSLGVKLFADGGVSRLGLLEVWTLASIW